MQERSEFGKPADAATWIAQLGAAIDHDLQADERGECGITVEEDVDVFVGETAARTVLAFRSVVLDDSDSFDASVARLALELNYGHLPSNFSLALDPESRQLHLLWTGPADAVDARSCSDILQQFASCVPQLRARFRELLRPQDQLGAAQGMRRA